MGFGEAIKTCFGKYASFTGRARRSEFWWFILFYFVVGFILNVIDNVTGLLIGLGTASFSVGDGQAIIDNPQVGGLTTIWFLITFLPILSVTVRRLHDTDRSGWWWWIQFIPCIGFIVILVFMLLDSTPGDNRFGPNPKGYAPLM